MTVVDSDFIRKNFHHFNDLPRLNVGSKRLISIGHDTVYKVIVTEWMDGAVIVYYDNPPASLVTECVQNKSGKAIYSSGFPYVVFKD